MFRFEIAKKNKHNQPRGPNVDIPILKMKRHFCCFGLTGEAGAEPHKSGQIHVKTLEEIRLEKAARLKDCLSDGTPETSSNKAAKSEKRVLTTKDQSSGPLRTLAEVCFAKRRRMQEQQPGSGTEKVPGRSQPEESAAGSAPAAAGSDLAAPNPTGIRVKTLEEIRREKAAKILSKQVSKAESTLDGEKVVKKTRLLKISKASLTGKNATNTI